MSAALKRRETLGAANKLILAGQARDALALLHPLEKRSRHDADVLRLLAIAYSGVRDMANARRCAERSHKLRPDPEMLLILAQSDRAAGRTDQAVHAYDQVLDRFPQAAALATIKKVGALEESGQFAAARAALPPPADVDALPRALRPRARFEEAKLLVHEKEYDDANRVIDQLVADPAVESEPRRALLHLKAKSCDRAGDYAGAFEAATAANEIGKLPFDPELYAEQVSILIENWSRDAMPHFPHADCSSELPVFVAGMPRSGTSLIDQIIDAHPRAAGVGELSDLERFAVAMSTAYDSDLPAPASFGAYDDKAFTRAAARYVQHCRKLSPRGTDRVVNKALGNNRLVGLLARLFPRTRIINAVRDPRDVAISCFMGGFNNQLSAWSTQIDWTAKAWAQSQRMMQHWKETLDVPILDVHYEALVADPEHQFRRIIAFIGLEWDDACMAFHSSRRTVRTLSYDQVNRPIYRTSSGRHRNYASFIEGIEFPAYVVRESEDRARGEITRTAPSSTARSAGRGTRPARRR
ncbi:MAG: hypothetical protein HKN62_04715 [Phycisphaerales bacterium]|nr:hypothetical protein [Phycisphaerales bacterium]